MEVLFLSHLISFSIFLSFFISLSLSLSLSFSLFPTHTHTHTHTDTDKHTHTHLLQTTLVLHIFPHHKPPCYRKQALAPSGFTKYLLNPHHTPRLVYSHHTLHALAPSRHKQGSSLTNTHRHTHTHTHTHTLIDR